MIPMVFGSTSGRVCDFCNKGDFDHVLVFFLLIVTCSNSSEEDMESASSSSSGDDTIGLCVTPTGSKKIAMWGSE